MANLKQHNGDFFSMVDDLFKKEWFDFNTHNGFGLGTKTPAVNIRETDTGFEFTVAAPGFSKEALKVSLEKELLTISADVETDPAKESETYSRKEFNFHNFKRSFRLPLKVVDTEKVEATYEAGILKVVVGKKDEILLPAREIKID